MYIVNGKAVPKTADAIAPAVVAKTGRPITLEMWGSYVKRSSPVKSHAGSGARSMAGDDFKVQMELARQTTIRELFTDFQTWSLKF
jgi:hypothetical protein